jgi:hypothetical protein
MDYKNLPQKACPLPLTGEGNAAGLTVVFGQTFGEVLPERNRLSSRVLSLP